MKQTLKKMPFYVLLAIVLSSCSTVHRVKSNKILANARVDSASFYAEIPFEYQSSLPVFEVEIEGKKYRFIFDTGGYTVFSHELIKELNDVRKVSYIAVKDGNGVVSQIDTYVLDNLKIGGVSFSEVGFAKIEFTESEWFTCLGLDGTIGPNIMKEALWQFDRKARRVTMTDQKNKFEITQMGLKVPIYTDNVFKPSLDLQIGDKSKRVGFDTGFNGFLKFMDNQGNGEFDQYPSVVRLGSRSNAGNSTIYTDTKMVKIDEVRLDGLLFTEIIASVGETFSSDLIGSQIFDYYKVMLDLSGKAMYLMDYADQKPISKSIESFGFGLDYREDKIVIDFVYKSSAAYNKGVKPGLSVVSINGEIIEFTSYCDFVEGFTVPDGNTIEIVLLLDNVPFKVKLKKEKIL